MDILSTPHGQPWKALWYLGLLAVYSVLGSVVLLALYGLVRLVSEMVS